MSKFEHYPVKKLKEEYYPTQEEYESIRKQEDEAQAFEHAFLLINDIMQNRLSVYESNYINRHLDKFTDELYDYLK